MTDASDIFLSSFCLVSELYKVLSAALRLLEGKPGLPKPGLPADVQPRVRDARTIKTRIDMLPCPNGGWKALLPSNVVDMLDDNVRGVGGAAGYDGTVARALLLAVRNLYHHPEQFNKALLEPFGILSNDGQLSPDLLFRFLAQRFPRLCFECYQLVKFGTPSPTEWNAWFLDDSGRAPFVVDVTLFIELGGDGGQHKTTIADWTAPFDLRLPHHLADGQRMQLQVTAWTRRSPAFVLLNQTTGGSQHVPCGRNGLNGFSCSLLLTAVGRFVLEVSNGQGTPAQVSYTVLDQIQFAGSLTCGPVTCSLDAVGIHHLHLPTDRLQPDTDYKVTVLEAGLDGQGGPRFNGLKPFDGPLTLRVSAATLATAQAVPGGLTEVILEYTRGPPPSVHLCLGTLRLALPYADTP